MDPLCLQSATQLARRIRQGELRSEDVVRAHILRLSEVNPRLNLVVQDRYDAALAEARACDAALAKARAGDSALREARASDATPAAGDNQGLPPFFGVPCTIKEAFALTGMPNTSGLLSRQGHIATGDAPAVARLKAAGGIPLGVTNVSELCMWMESHNKLYGRSRNPYDPRRTVGGSSGGEGGVVGAGGSPFGLGSDIGGSIRMPAFFNGVFGHKPTGGLVPATGQYPSGSGGQLRFVTTGPICRRAEDLWPLLKILAGPDGQDETCREVTLQDPSGVAIEDLNVLDVPDDGLTPVHPCLRAAQERVVTHLASRGARIVRMRIPALRHAIPIWASMLAAAPGPSYASLLANGGSFNLGWEVLRSLWGGSPFTVPSLGLAFLEKLPKLLPKGADRYLAEGESLKRELVERIGPKGVMIYPSYAEPAPRHWTPLFPPTRWAYTCILNVMELPSTQVPLGLDPRGLPLGVQVVGIHDHDHITVAVALALEKAFGGWVPPPPPR